LEGRDGGRLGGLDDDDEDSSWLTNQLLFPPSTGSPRRPDDAQLRHHTANIRPRSASHRNRNTTSNSPRPLSLPSHSSSTVTDVPSPHAHHNDTSTRLRRILSQQDGEEEDDSDDGLTSANPPRIRTVRSHDDPSRGIVGRRQREDEEELDDNDEDFEATILRLATQLNDHYCYDSTLESSNATNNAASSNITSTPARDSNELSTNPEVTSTGRTIPAPLPTTNSTTPARSSNDIFTNMNDRRLAKLARRAEEETELNRAILLSLQDTYPLPGMEQLPETNNGSGDIRTGGGDAVSQEDLNMLMAMGFAEDECRNALIATNQNVELAVNRLLGL
jgi:hypothetical protein